MTKTSPLHLLKILLDKVYGLDLEDLHNHHIKSRDAVDYDQEGIYWSASRGTTINEDELRSDILTDAADLSAKGLADLIEEAKSYQ